MKNQKGPKPRPPDDPAQSERFISTAKEIEADESGVSFERVMKAVTPVKTGAKPGAKRKPKG
jgi:hypothetical protein